MYQLDARDIRFVNSRIKEYKNDIKRLINVVIKELDATLILPDGGRPRQTNSFVWEYSNAEFHYLLNLLIDDGLTNEEYNDIMNRYNATIENNKKFELENPPIIYDKKRSKVKRTSKKTATTTDMFTGEKFVMNKSGELKPKKETIAERKAKLLNEKATKFAFSFKALKK